MKIEDRKNELIFLIEMYFKSEINSEVLFKYSWETINFFTDNRDALPPYDENEKTFWYAIWQLQHLADGDHEQSGTLKRALLDIDAYLRNQKILPKDYAGKRP